MLVLANSDIAKEDKEAAHASSCDSDHDQAALVVGTPPSKRTRQCVATISPYAKRSRLEEVEESMQLCEVKYKNSEMEVSKLDFSAIPACRLPWTAAEESWLRDWVHTHVFSSSYSGRIDWRLCSVMCKAQVCFLQLQTQFRTCTDVNFERLHQHTMKLI